MTHCIIIPAYNEAKRIGQVIEELLGRNFDMIVINDGSTDDTFGAVKKYPVYYAEHLVNQGQGAALRTGTYLAGELGFDVAVHFDADGQHSIDDLAPIIESFNDENIDVVLTTRFSEKKSELPRRKELILRSARMFSRLFLKLNFTDPQSGLRAIRLSALPKLNWQSDNFEHCTEILSLILKNDLNYIELPVTIKYDEYSMNKSVKPKVSMGLKLIANKIRGKI